MHRQSIGAHPPISAPTYLIHATPHQISSTPVRTVIRTEREFALARVVCSNLRFQTDVTVFKHHFSQRPL